MLCNLCHAKITTQAGELELLSHNLHLLLQLSRELSPHRILCHIFNASYNVQIYTFNLTITIVAVQDKDTECFLYTALLLNLQAVLDE